MAPLPAAQWRFGYPAAVVYPPAVVGLDAADRPRALPHITELNREPPFHAERLPATTHAILPISSPLRHKGHRGSKPPNRGRSSSPSLRSESTRCRRQPSWIQRMSQALRLPPGTASTIASSTAAGTPRHSGLVATEDGPSAALEASASPKREDVAPSVEECESPEEPILQLPAADLRGDAEDGDDIQSLQTNVATVHSDDFQMSDHPSNLLQQSGTTPLTKVGLSDEADQH
ncbi:hypothetical protein DCS_04837 [Drechmeria coniospora]|uniref:Uncharacterized protein n=1 Tax=Drechmeria coniospora TaxID=98403 RepID=A0A151GL39_DRECN|nr:hypothetical protein DCS_04837 [Drechmeria coniospora]KYK57824.1 hypothetical protein DCS_04837 [Drechmeria coniospora]